MLHSKIYLPDTSKMSNNSRNLCIFTTGKKCQSVLKMFWLHSIKYAGYQCNSCEEVSSSCAGFFLEQFIILRCLHSSYSASKSNT